MKLFIVDTAKADYSRDIPESMMHVIAHNKFGVAWWVGKDIETNNMQKCFGKAKFQILQKTPSGTYLLAQLV